MANIVPCLTSIECRWKNEITAKPDVVEVNRELREVTRNVELQRELKLRFDWYEQGVEQPLFNQVFPWGAEPYPAVGDILARKAATEHIGDGSIYAQVAKDLFALVKDKLAPANADSPISIKTYVPDFPVTRMRIHMPYHAPQERIVEIEVLHYLDPAFKNSAFKKTMQWLPRARKLEDETCCEELLNEPSIEPDVIKAIKKSAELVKSVYPLFNIDIEAWIMLAEDTINKYNPEPVEAAV